MGFRLLLGIYALLCLGGSALAEEPGTDFAVVFMENVLPNENSLDLKVILTPYFPETQVTIEMPNKIFKEVVNLMPEYPLMVQLPQDTEIVQSTRSRNTVHITSNRPISVVATNGKPHKTSITVLSPMDLWGRDYYVATPETGPENSLKQVAIVNGPQPNIVSILLSGTVVFENTKYLAGEFLNLTLSPWEAVQLQSHESLTGSHVLSQEPVALFAGRTCAEMRGNCQVCLQLPPVSAWGSTFASPPLPYQKVSSKVYILAATETQVSIVNGYNVTSLAVTPGREEEIGFDSMMPLLISSPGKILVLLYFGEGLHEPYEGFLIRLAPKESTCTSYSIVWVPGFENKLVVVAQADNYNGMQLNHNLYPELVWDAIPGTNLVYTFWPILSRSYNFIYNPGHFFGIATIGTAEKNSYGAHGICLDKVYQLCEFECRYRLQCPNPCKPPEFQNCMVWGTMHMKTFHGAHYFKSGNCQSQLLSGNFYPTNGFLNLERRHDQKILLRIRVLDYYFLEIPAKGPGTVLVNGELKYMPISRDNGQLNITRFGLYTFVKTTFGLKIVIGDNDGFVHVQIPSIYSDFMYGMCTNPTAYGAIIWSTQSNLNCNTGSLRSPTPCENIERTIPCSELVKSEIFKDCHAVLDPIPFVNSCEVEACETGNVCLGLAAYALACAIQNVNLTGWRSLNGCYGVQCPPQSHYESCPSSCPATCLETDCPTESCFESCICDGDRQLSPMGTCVLPNKCGCSYEEKYFSHGAKFLTENCSTQCHCNGNNLECQEAQGCDPDQICELKNGLFTCVKYLSCYMFGNSNYTRFDNTVMSRNGSCKSTMVEVCSNDLGLEYFSVRTDHENDLPHLAAVHIAVYGKNITLFPQLGQMYVDGVLNSQVPYQMDNRLFIESLESWRMTLYSDFGLLVSTDVGGGLFIKVPSTYQRGVCGLCSADNVTSYDSSCSFDCQGICPSCQLDESLHYLSKDMCGMLSDPNGNFRYCYRSVNPVPYVESCVNDLCNNRTICNSIASYVAACLDATRIELPQWRSPTFCDYTCPPNSYFSICANNCKTICAFNFPLECPIGCREGCVCNPGYIWSNNSCILPEDCGCYVGDQFLKDGETFYKDSCQVVCTCMQGKVICGNHSCSPKETCQDVGGISACYPKQLTCWVSGHKLHNFDFSGTTFSVYTGCTYTMVTTNCTSSSVADLELEIELSRSLSYSDVSTRLNAKLRIHGHTIIFKEYSNDIEIDGIPYPLPVDLENVIKVSGDNGMDRYVRIEADPGLILIASRSMVWISLPSNYAGNICGLCGNANGNVGDDTEGLQPTSCQASLAFSDSEMSAYNMTTSCDVILAVAGAFSNCHASISPNGFYSTCLNYASENLLPFLCNVIRGYATECQAINATVYPWENATLCAFNENPTPSIETQTFHPTSPNIQQPVTGYDAQSSRESGCMYYMVPNYALPARSSADPVSPTECYLLLASVDDATLEPFSIGVEYIVGTNQTAIILMIKLYGLHILIFPTVYTSTFEVDKIFVNMEPIKLPASLASGKVKLLYENPNLILGTDFGLIITLSQSGEIFILPPDNYLNHLHGWCAGNKLQFSNEEMLCNIKSESKEWSCKNETMHNACSPLLDEAGPFQACHNVSSPLAYYERCRRHFCESGGNQQAVCHVFQEYTQACQEQRAIIQPWRNDTFCTFQCPRGGLTYNICTKPCRMCQGKVCFASHCTEGCNCVEGLLWDGSYCVAPELCKEARPHETEHMFPPAYLSCSVDAFSLRTFGNLSTAFSSNGTYDLLDTCYNSSLPWMSIFLSLQTSLPGGLYLFFEKNLIFVTADLDVWINFERIALPVTVAPNLYLSKMEGVFSVVWQENMVLSFNQSGLLNIEVQEQLATKLCGLCTIGHSSQFNNNIFLDSWQAEDRS